MPRKQQQEEIFGAWKFGRTNYIIFAVGIATIILGYILMALGGATSPLSLTIAPLLLILGYLVLIPLGILHRPKGVSDSR